MIFGGSLKTCDLKDFVLSHGAGTVYEYINKYIYDYIRIMRNKRFYGMILEF